MKVKDEFAVMEACGVKLASYPQPLDAVIKVGFNRPAVGTLEPPAFVINIGAFENLSVEFWGDVAVKEFGPWMLWATGAVIIDPITLEEADVPEFRSEDIGIFMDLVNVITRGMLGIPGSIIDMESIPVLTPSPEPDKKMFTLSFRLFRGVSQACWEDLRQLRIVEVQAASAYLSAVGAVADVASSSESPAFPPLDKARNPNLH